MIKVFIASPYRTGDMSSNIRLQSDIYSGLMDLGFAPYGSIVSSLSQHIAHPKPHEEWVKIENEFISVCNCVLRVGGESKGADECVNYAKSLKKEIFYSINDLILYYTNEIL